MTATESANIATVREYLAALESGVAGEALAQFFTPDVRQIEFPNRLNPTGGESDLATILKRAEQGKKAMRQQKFTIGRTVAQGDQVAVEALWTGELSISLGTLEAGATMTAHFAIFLEFEDGRIRVQRNYDCFEPW